MLLPQIVGNRNGDGIATHGIILIPNVVKISQLVQKLKGQTDGQTDGHTHTHAHARTHTQMPSLSASTMSEKGLLYFAI